MTAAGPVATGAVCARLPLPAHCVHLWRCQRPATLPAECLAAYAAVLSAGEWRRAQGLPAPRRAAAIVTRALLRNVLSLYAAVAPAAWAFSPGKHGKPAVSGTGAGLQFNLSHSGDQIVLAVSVAAAVGVDVESCAVGRDTLRLARRYFAPLEVASLEPLAQREQTQLFYQFWCCKEAWSKTRGEALAPQLQRTLWQGDVLLSVLPSARLDRAGLLAAQLSSAGGADSPALDFWLLHLQTRFVVAVARERPVREAAVSPPVLQVFPALDPLALETVPIFRQARRSAPRALA